MQKEGRCSKYASIIPNRLCEMNVLTKRVRRVWGTTTKHLLLNAYALRKTGCIFLIKFNLTCNFDESQRVLSSIFQEISIEHFI